MAAAAKVECAAANEERRAEDTLAGAAPTRVRDEEEARRRGEEQRRQAELARDRAAWRADVDATLAPALAKYLGAVRALRDAEEEVERVRLPLNARAGELSRRDGNHGEPAAALNTNRRGSVIAALTASRAFGTTTRPHHGGELRIGSWGEAPWIQHPLQGMLADGAEDGVIAAALRLAREAGVFGAVAGVKVDARADARAGAKTAAPAPAPAPATAPRWPKW